MCVQCAYSALLIASCSQEVCNQMFAASVDLTLIKHHFYSFILSFYYECTHFTPLPSLPLRRNRFSTLFLTCTFLSRYSKEPSSSPQSPHTHDFAINLIFGCIIFTLFTLPLNCNTMN